MKLIFNFSELQEKEAVSELAQAYSENGVVFISDILNHNEIQEVKSNLEKYISDKAASLPTEHVLFEDNGIEIRNLWAMDLYDRFFSEFGKSEKLRRIVRILEGWEHELHYVEAFMKPSLVGSEVPLHQDLALQSPSNSSFITGWFPLDAVDEENGALRFILGSHRWGPLEHDAIVKTGTRLTTSNAKNFLQMPSVPTTLVPGDAAFFNGYTLHYSPPNKSERTRRALAVGMRGPGTVSKREVRNWGRVMNSTKASEIG